MALKRKEASVCFVSFLCFWASAYGLFSPKGVNFEGNSKISFILPFKIYKNGVVWVPIWCEILILLLCF
ncbi:hypothetical protein I3842_01G024600 [Carya illinoinensis]|uniref:Uncharacterized protein n=1 Tax=Carya illinoinensis TaxID=32201 RepID=A0A922FVN4_CARIL|nr:hypothetical protein I3842_01G024600 [Carya illinoinensis]